MHLRVEPAHFDWRWRERPALALLAWEAQLAIRWRGYAASKWSQLEMTINFRRREGLFMGAIKAPRAAVGNRLIGVGPFQFLSGRKKSGASSGASSSMGVARTADNHLLSANNNHDVANPGSRITSDGNLRRGEHLAQARVFKNSC